MNNLIKYTASKAKLRFGKILSEIDKKHVLITQYGEPTAVFLSYEDYLSLQGKSSPKANSSKDDLSVGSIVKELERKYPGKNIVLNKDSNGKVTEILCEIIQDPDFSKAVAVILEGSLLHFHKTLTETYLVTKGNLQVWIGNKEFTVREGESITFFPYQKHRTEGKNVWLEVYSQPGWRYSDHILVQD